MTARPTQDGIKSKSSKKRRRQDDDEPATATKEATSNDKKSDKKSAKKKAKEELLSKIPTHDSDGIPYSKIQIRRMKRRVKHGLDPIPTEEEEREIAKRKEEEKREVEECLFGEGDKDKKAKDDDSEDGEDASVHDEDDHGEEQNSEDDKEADEDQHQPTMPPTKKAKRTKPVPKDYICQACQNKPSPNTAEFTPHWIYDCPSKITKRGCNAKSKKLRGLNDPPSRKVFVSGLPFHVTEGGVKRFFEKESGSNNVEVVHVKLMKFEDSQRCKGQGILTFDSDESARTALKMNGCLWEDAAEEEGGKNKKKKGKVEKKEVKELRLKVTKVLNRFVTKQKKG